MKKSIQGWILGLINFLKPCPNSNIHVEHYATSIYIANGQGPTKNIFKNRKWNFSKKIYIE